MRKEEDLGKTQPHNPRFTLRLPRLREAGFGEKVAPVHNDGKPHDKPFDVGYVVTQVGKTQFPDPSETQRNDLQRGLTQETHIKEGPGTVVISASRFMSVKVFDGNTRYRPGDAYDDKK